MDVLEKIAKVVTVPDLEFDPYHPANDAFNRKNNDIKDMIVAHQRGMPQLHVEIVKRSFARAKNKQIAEELDVTPATVSRVLKLDKSKHLYNLLIYLQESLDGPERELRKAILFRIVVDNEKEHPKIAIQAMAELNKMDEQQKLRELGGLGGQVSITINSGDFPRTTLDG